MFRRGCTPDEPLAGPVAQTFSFKWGFSSPEVDTEVEKCFDEGARARGAEEEVMVVGG